MMRNDENLNKKLSKSKNPTFLTVDAKQAFTWLRQAFTEAPILSYFDPKRYIRIETDASGYAIGRSESADFWFWSMESSSLLFSKDDSGWDSIWNSWWKAPSHC